MPKGLPTPLTESGFNNLMTALQLTDWLYTNVQPQEPLALPEPIDSLNIHIPEIISFGNIGPAFSPSAARQLNLEILFNEYPFFVRIQAVLNSIFETTTVTEEAAPAAGAGEQPEVFSVDFSNMTPEQIADASGWL